VCGSLCVVSPFFLSFARVLYLCALASVCIPVFADFTAQQMLASLDGIGRRQLRMFHIAEAFVQRVFFKQTEKKKKNRRYSFLFIGLSDFLVSVSSVFFLLLCLLTRFRRYVVTFVFFIRISTQLIECALCVLLLFFVPLLTLFLFLLHQIKQKVKALFFFSLICF
jgi:hypothetical protein